MSTTLFLRGLSVGFLESTLWQVPYTVYFRKGNTIGPSQRKALAIFLFVGWIQPFIIALVNLDSQVAWNHIFSIMLIIHCVLGLRTWLIVHRWRG